MKIKNVKTFDKKGKTYLTIELEGHDKSVFINKKQVEKQTGLTSNFALLKGSDLQFEYYKAGEYTANNQKVREDDKLIKNFKITFSKELKNKLNNILNQNKSKAEEPEVAYKKEEKNKGNGKASDLKVITDIKNSKKDKEEKIQEVTQAKEKEETKTSLPSKHAFMVNLLKQIKNEDEFVRDKYFKLLAQEMEKLPDMEERIKNEIQTLLNEIEKKYFTQIISEKKNNYISKSESSDASQIDKNDEDKVHNPKNLVAFLGAFTSIDPIKYLTHPWDKPNEPFNYDKFIQKVRKKFIEHLEKFTSDKVVEINKANKKDKPNIYLYTLFKESDIPNVTTTKVFNFIFSQKPGWSFEHIEINWSSPELKEWCNNNPGRYPSDFELPSNKQSYGDKRFIFFKDLINKFKHEIEIRTDNFQYNLKSIVRDAFKRAGLKGEFKPVFDESLKEVECFIDVAQFKSGLIYILSPIANFTQFPNVEFKVSFFESYYELYIIHHESYFHLHTDHSKFSGSQGDFGSARKRLFNQCDWSVEGKFPDGLKKIDFLTKSDNQIRISDSKFDQGVKHTLKLYL